MYRVSFQDREGALHTFIGTMFELVVYINEHPDYEQLHRPREV